MPSRPHVLTSAAMLALLVALACSEPPPRRWVHLADGFVPDPAGHPPAAKGIAIEPAAEPGASWVETTIPGAAWRPDQEHGRWIAERPLAGGFGHFDLDVVRLREPSGKPYRIVDPPKPRAPVAPEVGDCYLTPEHLHLFLGAETPPLDGVRYAVRVDAGKADGGRWKPALGAFSGDGVWVWPGGTERLELPPGGKEALRFTTLARPFQAPGAVPELATFRLALDGQPLFEATQGVLDRPQAHVVPLPASDAPRTLALSVEGPPGEAAFFAPELGPRDVGTYGDRPWGDPRPNVIVFLIDTFRADNLTVYGGLDGRAPAIDRLAARSLAFRRAWSTAAWTLPAQVSLLTGLFPKEHGATGKGRALPAALQTLAETLAEHGYRTGAVTDAGFISRNFGLDAGFEWFEEVVVDDWDLTRTFDAALEFLDRDDGRPVFLYVHTYRTHSPYRRGVEEDVGPWHELMARVQTALAEPGSPTRADVRARFADEFRALYLDGVEALDAEFGPWFEALEHRGVFAPGYFLLTSDHGEAFGEHGDMVHGGRLWEEKVRVPLLFFGPDVQPGVRDVAGSLVDVARTVAAFARVPPDPSWHGRALQDLREDRPVFVYGEEVPELGSRIAIVDGAYKVMGPSDVDALVTGGAQQAFDLAQDPGETRNLRPGAAWPTTLCRDLADVLRAQNRSRTAPSEGRLTDRAAADLEKIGYGGR